MKSNAVVCLGYIGDIMVTRDYLTERQFNRAIKGKAKMEGSSFIDGRP